MPARPVGLFSVHRREMRRGDGGYLGLRVVVWAQVAAHRADVCGGWRGLSWEPARRSNQIGANHVFMSAHYGLRIRTQK